MTSILNKLPIGLSVFTVMDGADPMTCGLDEVIFSYATPFADVITGGPITSVVGLPVPEAWPTPEAQAVVQQVIAAMRTGKTIELGENAYGDEMLPDAVYQMQAIPIDERTGGLLYTNVSEKVALRKAAEQSAREQERFAYVASHDLQEPLRTIQTWIDFLDEDAQEAIDAQDWAGLKKALDSNVARIQRACARQRSLIEALLLVSRSTSTEMRIRTTAMESLLDAVLELLEPLLKESRARVVVEGRLGTYQCDPALISQVLQNLIINGVRYAQPGVPAVITVRRADGRLEIEDNGIGIEPQYLERIFGMFRRLEAGSEVQGHGIGLTVSRQIVERHGGKIGVESSVDVGSTFWFTLPGGSDDDSQDA